MLLISIEQQRNVESTIHSTRTPLHSERHARYVARCATHDSTRYSVMDRDHAIYSIDKRTRMMYNDTMIEQESNLGLGGRSTHAAPTSITPKTRTQESPKPEVNITMIIVSTLRRLSAAFLIVGCGKLENFFPGRLCCCLNSESIFCNSVHGIFLT